MRSGDDECIAFLHLHVEDNVHLVSDEDGIPAET